MKIDTPVATMGIRGTTPHVEISDDGTVKFSTLVEENKAAIMERQRAIEENKRAAPAKRQAKREPPENKNFEASFRLCRGC
jgi:hypothetical protein